MAISHLPPEELIKIDSGYPERISARAKTIRQYPDLAAGFTLRLVPAVEEWYEYIMGYYLPIRYPGLFILQKRKPYEEASEECECLINRVTGQFHPAVAPSRDFTPGTRDHTDAVNSMLKSLATTIEEDFLILSPPDPTSRNDTEYIPGAFVTCHPAGFSPRLFLGSPLSAIHKEVPNYRTNLQMSMTKFFPRIKPGKPWRRWNWGITPHNVLFTPTGDPLWNVPEEIARTKRPGFVEREFDAAEARLRVEYQTLTRLPQSGAVVFTVRTYLTSLKELKEMGGIENGGTEARLEPGWGTPSGGGGAEDLATALEGLTEEVAGYKGLGGGMVGKMVEFLRS